MKLMSGVLAGLLVCASSVSAQWGNWLWAVDSSGTIYRSGVDGDLITTVASGRTAPRCLAVGDAGDLYVTVANGLYRIRANLSVQTLYTGVGTTLNQLAFDVDGELWATDAGTGSVYQINSTGSALQTLQPNGVTATDRLAVSRGGHVWFNEGNTLYQYTRQGALVRSIATAGGTISALAVDKNDRCWAAYSGNGQVLAYDGASGNVMATITSTGPIDVLVNVSNEVYVLTASQLQYYTSNGLAITSVTLPAGTYLSAGLDMNGDIWTNTSVGTLGKFDRYTLSLLDTVTSAPGLTIEGDASGFVDLNINQTLVTDDADLDQVSNSLELGAGSNPVVAQSTPANPQPILSVEPSEGNDVWLTVRQFNDALLGYSIRGSLGNNPSNYLQVPNTQLTIPVEVDNFFYYVQNAPWVVPNADGFLDANGTASTRIRIPNASGQLVGVTFFFAFVTLDQTKPQPITTISNNLPIQVQ